ncbi:hypothetical protein HF086_003329 [Spodoptera exigua]|uniref:Uncharacterized protein n=1 Tax=Spodoptera exigua TaxID=7107 RepID=A0A922MY40_SPOEX|nr:hypothetical protein HF086_003329 [Spodoptera exigua]
MSNKRSRFTPFLKQNFSERFKLRTEEDINPISAKYLLTRLQCFVTSAVGINLIGHGAVVGFAAVLLPQLHEPHSDIHTTKAADSWIGTQKFLSL